MPLILRSVLGTKLSIAQMDGNLTYLAGTLSGSVIQVTGSSFSAPSTAITASVVSASFTGSLFGSASYAATAGLAQKIEIVGESIGANAYEILFVNSTGSQIAYAELNNFYYVPANDTLFVDNIGDASTPVVITGSLFGTSSWANNARSASFASTASYFSGSITNAISASYAITASIADKIKVVNVGGAAGITYPLLGNTFNGDATVYTIQSPDYKYDVTNSQLIVSSISSSFTGSVSVNGLMNLQPSNPLPSATNGSIVYSSSGDFYFGSGSAWRKLTL
jgi:hypothetical protein